MLRDLIREWKLWSIYRVSNGNRECVGTRAAVTVEEVMALLRYESHSRFETSECTDPELYERAITYHETMAGRNDVDPRRSRDHRERAQGLKRTLRRLKIHA